MTDVRAAGNVNTDYIQNGYSAKKDSVSLFNDPRATMNTPQQTETQAPSDAENNDTKTKREKELTSLATDHKLQLKDIENFLNKALGYTLEQVYELSEEEYSKIADRLIPSTLEAIEEKYNGKCTASRLMDRADKIKVLKDGGKTIDEISDQNCTFGDEDFLGLVKKVTGKNYKAIADISEKELEDIMKSLLQQFAPGKGNVLEKCKIMQELLATITKVDHEDYTRLYNVFRKVAPEADSNFAVLMDIIEKLKNNKGEFEKFLTNDLAGICQANNLDYEKTKGLLVKIAEAIKDGGLDNVDTLRALYDSINPENIYNSYKEKQANGKELSEAEQKYITTYEKIKQIEKKKQLSPEEEQFLRDFEQNIELKLAGLKNGIKAANATINPKAMGSLLKDLPQKDLEDIFNKIYDLQRLNPEYALDVETLDKITDGKFSKFEPTLECVDGAAISAESAESTASGSSSVNNGIGFDLASRNENYALNPKVEKPDWLTNTEAPVKYTVEKPGESTANLLTSSFVTMKTFKDYVDEFSFEEAVVEAGKQFQKMSFDVRSIIEGFAADMKYDKLLLDFANKCHNNATLMASAIFPHLKNIESIEDSTASFDAKKVAEKNYRQMHGDDESKQKKAV